MDPALCTYDAGQGTARRNDGNNRCTRNCRHNKATKANYCWKPLPCDTTACWSIHFCFHFCFASSCDCQIASTICARQQSISPSPSPGSSVRSTFRRQLSVAAAVSPTQPRCSTRWIRTTLPRQTFNQQFFKVHKPENAGPGHHRPKNWPPIGSLRSGGAHLLSHTLGEMANELAQFRTEGSI